MPRDAVPIPAHLSPDAPEWALELDEAILAGGELPEPARQFVVDTRGKAEWAMRKLSVLHARGEEVTEQARAWRDRIQEWEAEEIERVAPSIRFFARLLEEYGLRERAARPREATLRLPSGNVATTLPATPKVEITDEAALLEWAANFLPGPLYEQVVKTTEKVLLPELRKIVVARPVERPWCSLCGGQLLEAELVEGDPPRWVHNGAPHEEWDHDATPGTGYEVVLNLDPEQLSGGVVLVGPLPAERTPGEVIVPGVEAHLAEPTARVVLG